MKPVISTAVSKSGTSTCWPTPWRSRAASAMRMALLAIIAVAMSITAGPVRTPSPG